MGWIRALILLCASTSIVAAQLVQPVRRPRGSTTLQLGTPIERTITTGETHTYEVPAQENSLIQITVEQRGIDVVVRVYRGKRVAEYDSPNGADGPENVSFVAGKDPARVEVTPLSREPGPSGKYEIRLIEVREATDQEIKESQGQEALKARGLALLGEIEAVISELRLPQTRIKAQVQAAGLLWESDEKRALKYVTDAIAGFRDMLTNFDPNSKEYTRNYHMISNLRHELVQVLTARQPELALSFIRSTPPLRDPYGNQRDLSMHEATMELQIADQLLQKDPKRTFEIAREILKSRYSSALTNTISTLRQKNPELAAELANEAATKLLNDNLLKNSQAAHLAVGLIQISAPSRGNHNGGGTNGSTPPPPLLSEQQRRDLLQKAMREALGYKPPAPNFYSFERDAASTLLHALQSIAAELDGSISGGAAAVEKKLKELNTSHSPQMDALQQFHNAINDTNMPFDEVLQTLARAPREQKDQLYIQLSNRAMNNGDMARARQIVNDYVTAPYQRQQALYNLEQQEMFRAMGKGKVEEALRNVANVSTAQERAQMLSQLANQIGPGYKRAAALLFLEQARALLPPSAQAQDQAQMQALFEMTKAFARYDSKRAFEMFDPLVDQFNDISAAARTMEGFGGEFFEQEELNLQNGNVVANVATQMTATLGTLALSNFDRAKLTADRIRLPEVRLRAYLDIAQHAIQNTR